MGDTHGYLLKFQKQTKILTFARVSWVIHMEFCTCITGDTHGAV